MNLHKRLRPVLSVAVVALASLFLTLACERESAPTPTPTPDVDVLLSMAGDKLAALTTAKFKLVDELESGAKFFGTTFKRMEAEVQAPDRFRMVADVVAPGFGFVQIEIVAVGDQAFVKLSKDAPWAPLSLDQLPFSFGGLGMTLRDLLPKINDVAMTGRESVLGVPTVRIAGTIASEELAVLIATVDPGHEAAVTLWIDPAEYTLRQIRIKGQIHQDDAPETVRLLTIDAIDVPVEIQLPDVGSGS